MTSPDIVAIQIRRSLRILLIATVVLYLGVLGIAVWTWSTANTNNDALCALRVDLQKRVANSQTFLKENPEGIPGISVRIVQDGIENQQRTISALSGLSC